MITKVIEATEQVRSLLRDNSFIRLFWLALNKRVEDAGGTTFITYEEFQEMTCSSDLGWPVYSVPPTDNHLGNYIWLSMANENDAGTKDQFISQGNYFVTLVSRTKGTDADRLAIDKKLRDVLRLLKPVPLYTPQGFFIWEVSNITYSESFSGDTRTFIYLCTINFQGT